MVENANSEAHLMMLEALDRASAELDKSVKSAVEQLTAFNSTLEKALLNRFQKIQERSTSYVEISVEELATHKEELAKKILEFERSEIETIIAAGKEIRHELNTRAQKANDSICRLAENEINELRSLIEIPEGQFNVFIETSSQTLKNVATSGKDIINDKESECEKALTLDVQDIEKRVQELLANAKRATEEKLEKYNTDFQEKISNVLDKLSELVAQTLIELSQKTRIGEQAIENSKNSSKSRLANSLKDWTDEVKSLSTAFAEMTKAHCDSHETAHSERLEHKAGEAKDEIDHIAQDATAKIASTHKLFLSSLKRLEKKYYERLERVLNRFESQIAKGEGVASVTNYPLKSTHELRELLSLRLHTQGAEIVKTFRRQIEQVELEVARLTSSSHERLESIRSQAVESLDKQTRIVKSELDRISRSFQTELKELSFQLPQIGEAGHAAALAVMTYRSARLSFSGE